MKRRLTVGIGILSGFVFFVTFLLGVGVSSNTVWKEIVPFLGIMFALSLVMLSGKTCCRSKRSC